MVNKAIYQHPKSLTLNTEEICLAAQKNIETEIFFKKSKILKIIISEWIG